VRCPAAQEESLRACPVMANAMSCSKASGEITRAGYPCERFRRALALLCVSVGVVGPFGVAGCGGDGDELADDAVARVGETSISKADFERALRFATGRGNDPRDYAACVESKRQFGSEAGGAAPADAKLKKLCREEYARIKAGVMDYLIKAEWRRQEAKARGIAVAEDEVKRAFDKAQQGGIFDARALEKAGVSEDEAMLRVRGNLLHFAVQEQVTAGARNVSAKDVAEYYRRNKAELVVPDRRDLHIVITPTRARAMAAKAALEDGRSWKSVATEYSVHISRQQGGRVKDARKGPSETGLGATIFAAKRGELIGPVKDDDTWAVFVVRGIKPSYQPTLEQAQDEIVEHLRTAREKRALDAYAEKYRDKTTCLAGYTISACGNGPRERGED
jgi:foldase protein PrsA